MIVGNSSDGKLIAVSVSGSTKSAAGGENDMRLIVAFQPVYQCLGVLSAVDLVLWGPSRLNEMSG